MALSDNPAPPSKPPARPSAEAPASDVPSYTANLPAVIAPRPKRHGRWRTGAALVLVLAAAGVAFAYHDQLASRLTEHWRTLLVDRTTPPRPQQGPHVELDMAMSTVEIADGRYVVRGELVNAGTEPGSTTTLKLVFRKGDDVLGERTYPLIEGPIAPGQRQSFSRPFEDPPDGTTNVIPSVK